MMVRTTVFSVLLAMSTAAAANPVPTENNHEAEAILNSPNQKAASSIITLLPKKLRCGDVTIFSDKVIANSQVTVNSSDVRFVYLEMSRRDQYDIFRVNIDDLRELNNGRTSAINGTEVYGFDHSGLFLASEDVTCSRPK